jgi:hypothetical protein
MVSRFCQAARIRPSGFIEEDDCMILGELVLMLHVSVQFEYDIVACFETLVVFEK